MSARESVKPKVYYLSVDTERDGDNINNSLIALGAVFGPADGSWARSELKRFRGNLLPLPGQSPDPVCKKEFWDNYQAVYAEIQAGARPAGAVMTDFLAWCQQLVALYEDMNPVPSVIKIITDAPDQDLGNLKMLGFATGTWTGPIRNLGSPRYHQQVDPCERLAAIGHKKQCQRWIEDLYPGVVHDHRPDNDAEHSYYQMVYLHQCPDHKG